MLQLLQQKMSGLLAKIVLGIIVVIFGGFFGIEQYFNPRSETFIAKVDGHPIAQDDFRDRYNNLRMQMQRAYGKAFDPQSFDTPETKRRVLDQMINEQLILSADEKLGVTVPPGQIRSEIESFPVFQVGGKFNLDQYRMWLDSQRKSPAEFEQTVRQNLQTRQLTDQLALGTVVTDAQVNDYLRLRDQTRDFHFVKIDRPTTDAKISDDAIAAYYKAHPQQFMTPEEISLDYVELNEATMQAKADVDDATLKQEYADQKSHFVAPEQRLASHILISVGKNANAAAQKAALAKAQSIEKQLKEGKTFEALAKADSDDLGSKAQGGDLGWLEKGITDPAFESALFGMKKGEISAPIKSEEGYHIIDLRDVHPEKVRSFDEVKGELAKKYLDEARDRKYSDISGKLTDAVYQDPTSLAPAAKDLGLTVQKTGLFSRNGGQGIASNPAVVKAAFSNNVLVEGNTSDPITLGPNHIVVIRVDQHDKSMSEPLDKVSDAIRKILVEQQSAKQAHDRADALFARLKKGESLEKIAAELKLKPSQENGIGRKAANLDHTIVEAVFKLDRPKDGKTVAGEVALANDAYALIELDGVKDADPAKLDSKSIEAARNELRQSYGQEAVREFIDSLRKSAKIEIAEDRLK